MIQSRSTDPSFLEFDVQWWNALAPHPVPHGAESTHMPHIRVIEPEEASGRLKEEYDAAVARAGKVFNVVKAMSLSPRVLKRSMDLYKAVMFGPSPLSRAERELLAVVVSCANDCHY